MTQRGQDDLVEDLGDDGVVGELAQDIVAVQHNPSERVGKEGNVCAAADFAASLSAGVDQSRSF